MKIKGTVKWFNNHNGYGYITGEDDELYYFRLTDCINMNETFDSGDYVLFEPDYVGTEWARKVEKVIISG